MDGPWAFALLLAGAIIVLLAIHATRVVRREKGQRPGSPPGKGHHVIEANYFSGGGGGGQAHSFTVPKDPQEYARRFVPGRAKQKDEPQPDGPRPAPDRAERTE